LRKIVDAIKVEQKIDIPPPIIEAVVKPPLPIEGPSKKCPKCRVIQSIDNYIWNSHYETSRCNKCMEPNRSEAKDFIIAQTEDRKKQLPPKPKPVALSELGSPPEPDTQGSLGAYFDQLGYDVHPTEPKKKPFSRKEYYQKYMIQYRLDNKERLIEKAKAIIECECGQSMQYNSLFMHRKSRKHRARLASQ